MTKTDAEKLRGLADWLDECGTSDTVTTDLRRIADKVEQPREKLQRLLEELGEDQDVVTDYTGIFTHYAQFTCHTRFCSTELDQWNTKSLVRHKLQKMYRELKELAQKRLIELR